MYIILLNKLRFDQISCSGRSGTRWQYEVSKWYEIVKRLGIPDLRQLWNQSLHHKRLIFWGHYTQEGHTFTLFTQTAKMGHTCVGPQTLRWP